MVPPGPPQLPAAHVGEIASHNWEGTTSGRIDSGARRRGNDVPAASVGAGYVSPGYATP
jgi:hypothetical protein